MKEWRSWVPPSPLSPLEMRGWWRGTNGQRRRRWLYPPGILPRTRRWSGPPGSEWLTHLMEWLSLWFRSPMRRPHHPPLLSPIPPLWWVRLPPEWLCPSDPSSLLWGLNPNKVSKRILFDLSLRVLCPWCQCLFEDRASVSSRILFTFFRIPLSCTAQRWCTTQTRFPQKPPKYAQHDPWRPSYLCA